MLGVSVALSSMLDEEEQAFPKMSFGEGPDKAGTLFIAVVPKPKPALGPAVAKLPEPAGR